MNILVKAFDGPDNRLAIEQALRDIPLDTCITIVWEGRETPTLNVKEHIVLNSRKYKKCDYCDIDWTTITPLDEELIEQMRVCEGIFMTMITRHSVDDIPFAERKRQYYEHLRYWNHMLETKKIAFFLINHAPHQSFDLVIYFLCLLKKIPTLVVHRVDPLGFALMVETYEAGATQVRDTFHRLQKEYADVQKPIDLPKKLERYYIGQTVQNESPWYMHPRHTYLLQKNFIRKWLGIVWQLFLRKPFTVLKFVTSPRVWKRKLREHRTIAFYDQHTRKPDFSKPYVYAPLHMQPEATTCPVGGVFVDQELIIQLLAWHLPLGVGIYVKEHPHQKEQMRSPDFYQALLNIPSVTLVPRDTSTVELTEHASAIATVTGTAGFEGLFKEKPVLLFGHIYYQYAVGVHMIRSSEDCRIAIEKIFVKKEKPSHRDIRLYLKAIGEHGSTYDNAPLGPDETITLSEQNVAWGQHMGKVIKKLLKL